MSGIPPVIIISNDIVPGLGMPVAAPGLRAFGLAEGLRSNGVETKIVMVRSLVNRQWEKRRRPVPQPTAPGVEVIEAKYLASYLESHAPATAVMINSNQAPHLRPIDGVKYVLDFFAPRMLETLYQDEGYPADRLRELRQMKIQAIELADAFIVNGAKKVPYLLGWILQTGRDIRHLPLEVVNMCVLPVSVPKANGGPLRFVMSGYLQGWSIFGNWIEALGKRLDRPGVSLELLLPPHWGVVGGSQVHRSQSLLDGLAAHESVTTHGPMRFSDFQRFLSGTDVSIDLFQHTLERECAVVTRSVVALACGTPVIHPPFTEVSPMIAEYDAGWLVDPEDAEALEAVLDEIITDQTVVQRKAENARMLAKEVIDPTVAVRPLVEIIRSW